MMQTTFIPQGWECPKCKRVYSPTTSICSYCSQHTQGTATTETTLTANSSNSSNAWMVHNFEVDKKSTKCKICGLQKLQHPFISYT